VICVHGGGGSYQRCGRWEGGKVGRWDGGTVGRWDGGTVGRCDGRTRGQEPESTRADSGRGVADRLEVLVAELDGCALGVLGQVLD
jgi:hypothetical protein